MKLVMIKIIFESFLSSEYASVPNIGELQNISITNSFTSEHLPSFQIALPQCQIFSIHSFLVTAFFLAFCSAKSRSFTQKLKAVLCDLIPYICACNAVARALAYATPVVPSSPT